MTWKQALHVTSTDQFAQDGVGCNVQLVSLPHMLSSSLPAPPLASSITPLSLQYQGKHKVVIYQIELSFVHTCLPEQVKHLCLDNRASVNLLEDVLQRLCKSVAILLLVCMIEVSKQQPVLPPAELTSWVIQKECACDTCHGCHAKKSKRLQLA